MSERTLNPGSKEAGEQGCTCPVVDNGRGFGLFGDGEKYGWVVSGECPLHGEKAGKKAGEAAE